jgi:hypothetical protein
VLFGQVPKFVTVQARATDRLGPSAVADRLDTRFLAHQPASADVFHFDKQ